MDRVRTLFEEVGGHGTFDALVADFYAGVAGDPELLAMYPEADLGPAAERLRLFLEQLFGGPDTYTRERGHPRLRMRHAPFVVTPAQRDRWLGHMFRALDRRGLPAAPDAAMREYFTRAADAMVNAVDPAE